MSEVLMAGDTTSLTHPDEFHPPEGTSLDGARTRAVFVKFHLSHKTRKINMCVFVNESEKSMGYSNLNKHKTCSIKI